MEEVKGPQPPIAKQFEEALSQENVPKLQAKTTAVALATINESQSPKPMGPALTAIIDSLKNDKVVKLLIRHNRLLTVLKTIREAGGEVDEIGRWWQVEDEQFSEIVREAPDLKQAFINVRYDAKKRLDLLNKETLEHLVIRTREDMSVLLPKILEFSNLKRLYVHWWSSKDRQFGKFKLPQLESLVMIAGRDPPVDDLSFLSDCPQLIHLGLSGMHVKDWSGLSTAKGLKELDISRTNFNDFSLLTPLKDLQALNLSQIKLNDWSSLGKLDSITHLNLVYSNFNDLSILAELKQLVSVLLNAQDKQHWDKLANLGYLRILGLLGNTSSTDLLPLAKSNLQLLILDSGSDLKLPTLQSVEALILRAVDISDLSDLVKACPNLRLVSINYCKEIKDLKPLNSLENLEAVYLAGKGADIGSLDDRVEVVESDNTDMGLIREFSDRLEQDLNLILDVTSKINW